MRRILVGVVAGLIAIAAATAACTSDDDGSSSSSSSSSSSGSSGGTDGGSGADTGSGNDSGANDGGDSGNTNDAAIGAMTLTSTSFTPGGAIPADHSCDGAGVSIPLAWSGAPTGTQSYAIVMRDLTLGGTGNYHWVIWDIPGTTTSLPDDIEQTATPDPPGGGARQTTWSFGAQFGYGNVCPPEGQTHEYELVVYSFSVATLPIGQAEGPNAVDAVIQANKTASGSLKGSYTDL